MEIENFNVYTRENRLHIACVLTDFESYMEIGWQHNSTKKNRIYLHGFYIYRIEISRI